VNKLAGRGLIERRSHPRHGNVRGLHLTERGRAEVEGANLLMADIEGHLRQSLGVQDYEQLRCLLDAVTDLLPAWAPPDTVAH
jgi:DNA-binding MarR family transcriptional regulator